MMAALKASGLPLLSNSRLDGFTARHPVIDGYKPTKTLLYEVGRSFYLRPNLMRDLVANDIDLGIKVFYDGLPVLPVGEYTVIFMHRDPGEIAESLLKLEKYKQSFNKDESLGDDGHTSLFEIRDVDMGVEANQYPFHVYRKYKPDDVQHCLDIVKQRRDIDVIEVQFSDLIKNPVKTLNFIRKTPCGRIRVPIDVEKAAAVIDPDWYRCVA